MRKFLEEVSRHFGFYAPIGALLWFAFAFAALAPFRENGPLTELPFVRALQALVWAAGAAVVVFSAIGGAVMIILTVCALTVLGASRLDRRVRRGCEKSAGEGPDGGF